MASHSRASSLCNTICKLISEPSFAKIVKQQSTKKTTKRKNKPRPKPTKKVIRKKRRNIKKK